MSLPLHIITICYNSMPFLPMQLATFNRLRIPWTWHVVEGPANNVNDTKWCKKLMPGLSTDGTHEFLLSLKNHPRCRIVTSPFWKNGKTQMVNAAIEHIGEPSVLVQIDSDELWLPEQLERIVQTFEMNPKVNSMLFKCRYFLGHNIVTTGEDCYGNNPGEWLRAFRFEPGNRFTCHEPPRLSGAPGLVLDRDTTTVQGLVFDHHAWTYPAHVAFKEAYYGYAGALAAWERLQANEQWPVKRLKDFLPWVDERAGADLLHKI